MCTASHGRLTKCRDGIEGTYPPRIDTVGSGGVWPIVRHPSAAAQTTQELEHDRVCRDKPRQKSDSSILVASKSLPLTFRQAMELAVPRDPAFGSVQVSVWVVFVAFRRVCRVCNANCRSESVRSRRVCSVHIQIVAKARPTTVRALRCAANSEASVLAECEMRRRNSLIPVIVYDSAFNTRLFLRSHLRENPVSSRPHNMTRRTLSRNFNILQPRPGLTPPQILSLIHI